MIAMPASVFALDPPVTVSVASLKFAENRVLTVLTDTEPVAVSSASAASVALPLATGASFTAVTLWLTTTPVELYGVVPPELIKLAVAPVVTVVLESMSLVVSVGAAPFQLDAGANRRLSVLLSVRAAVARPVTEDIVVHVLPSEEYCQVPFAASAV